MLLARQVFQAKYGRGDELVALFWSPSSDSATSACRKWWAAPHRASAFTVVREVEVVAHALRAPAGRLGTSPAQREEG